jgi:ribosomal protein S18 acetylase RimI-like enzyme
MELAERLDNVIWDTLTGPHARFAAGSRGARRYAPGYTPLAAFSDPGRPDFDALLACCAPGEVLAFGGWAGAVPAGWEVVMETTMFQMVWDAPTPETDEAADAMALGPEHAAQALALATLTRPGPFAERTTALGDYFGYFEGERLVAMVGERLFDGRLREVSGVCTHPDYLGRGYARALVAKLVRREMLRGETPFLHVVHDNHRAHGLYLRMGFRDAREVVLRAVTRR